MDSSDSEAENVEALIKGPNELEYDSDETDDNDIGPLPCLICTTSFENAESLFRHCKEEHKFDFLAISRDLDFLNKVKLVNYIRTQVKNGASIQVDNLALILEPDEFLRPVLDDDPVLLCLDDLDLIQDRSDETAQENEQLKAQIETLTKRITAYESIERIDRDGSQQSEKNNSSASSANNAKTIQGPDNDKYYFDSYAHTEIHEIMLKDTVRTDAYRDFIYNNKDIIKGKTVLDVGCGTGILSMFAAKAGARQVIAVDNSDVLERAQKNIKENGLDSVIKCVAGKIEQVQLPVTQVDIIISEWMGYGLLYESMLDSVLFARDKYLKPTSGLMAPSETRLLVTAIEDDEYIPDRTNFWNDVYGFKMSAMKPDIDEPMLQVFPESAVIANPDIFQALPLHTVTESDLSFSAPFKIQVNRKAEMNAILIYFDTFFTTSRNEKIDPDSRAETWRSNVKEPVGGNSFTTGPWGKPTHWKSTALILPKPIGVESGDTVTGTISYAKNKKFTREIEVTLTLLHKEYAMQKNYYLR